MKPTRAALAAPLLLLLLGAPADAQAIAPLVLEGDPVAGVGLVTSIANLAVNSAGSWRVEVDTDNADTDADGALLADGSLLLREGDALAAPPGALLDSFDSVALDVNGNASFNHFLDGTAGSGDDSGVYWNDALVVQESAVSGAPQLSPGTPYIGFFDTKTNDARRVLVMASIDDPAIATSVDRALVVFELDPAGAVLAENVLFKEGDVLPGQTEAVSDFETDPQESDFNDLGQVLFGADLTGDTALDGVVYLDGLKLAQEGDPSPVAGRNWLSLLSSKVGLNNAGQVVFTGRLDGDTATDSVIVKDGAVLVQEGDALPAFAPFLLESFGSGPVRIADSGDVLWYGEWSDPDADVDSGLFLNDQLIVQEGVSTVNGVVIDTLRGVTEGYAISDDGRWVIFEAVLADGTEGAFLFDAQAQQSGPFCFGDGSGAGCPCGNEAGAATGCLNSSGAGAAIAMTGTASASADDLGFDGSGMLFGQPALLFGGEAALNGGDGVPFGDGLRCAGNNVLRLGVRTPDAGGAASWGPGLVALAGYAAGDVRHFQGWYRDPVGGPCGSGFNLTQGFTVVFEP